MSFINAEVSLMKHEGIYFFGASTLSDRNLFVEFDG